MSKEQREKLNTQTQKNRDMDRYLDNLLSKIVTENLI